MRRVITITMLASVVGFVTIASDVYARRGVSISHATEPCGFRSTPPTVSRVSILTMKHSRSGSFQLETVCRIGARIDHTRGIVWISQPGNDAIASFDMATDKITEHPLPTRMAFIRHLDVDQDTGAVWGADSHTPAYHPKIVRLETGQ